MENDYHATRHFSNAGRVVYTRESMPGAPDYPSNQHLMLWNSTTGEKLRIEHGLEGDSLLSGFDGHWTLFRQRFAPNGTQDGLWAYHVDDGRRVHIYHPLPNERLPDRTWGHLDSETVVDGLVYYSIREGDGVSRLYELDLSTSSVQLMEEWDGTFCCFRGDDRYVVWAIALSETTAHIHVWALDLETGEIRQVSNHTKGVTIAANRERSQIATPCPEQNRAFTGI